MILTRAAAGLLALAALAGCHPDDATARASSSPAPAAAARAASCHVRGTAPDYLPDPACTPGATNPAVTQATIRDTICRPGWATLQRPPSSWSEPRKAKAVRAYGYYAGKSLRGYEYDHLVPISLGGAVADEANLWPEADASPNPKDAVEARVRRAVCAGRMTLAAAQEGFERDWTSLR